ncbi:MAG: hydroxymethylglutaryl-CoA lyase [Deltaproteobacteria bacterium]|nr:hydroxymethylglutaryl-CoA lyase [Deltaproteobacteria bacterium]
MMPYPKKVTITEVGPRDGLQNEKVNLSTSQKVQFIDALTDAGFQSIEVTSFVNPKWVPQMGDAWEVYKKVHKKKDVRYMALVPNATGMQKALTANVTSIAVFTAASESFTRKNINMSIEESLEAFKPVIDAAKSSNIWIRGYVSTCFSCPYEGKIDPQKVLEVSEKLLALGVHELSLGDTIGVATPLQVEELLGRFKRKIPFDKIALHFHDTRGTALANVLAGLQQGISKFDSSAGGLGGCPYAPGASGNLASEDLVYMLNEMGIETGIDLSKLVQASKQISKILGRALPSRYLQSAKN